MTATPEASVRAPVTDVTRPLDAVAAALVVVLCLTWGFNQVAVKLALPDFPPLWQATVRSLIAMVLVGGWMWFRGIPIFNRDGTLIAGLVAGALFALEFIFIYRGLLWTTASRAVLFIYTMPFWVVIGARWVLPDDKFRPSQWLGLLLAFVGMVIAFGLPTPAAHPRELIGDIMMVVGAMGWAATTLVIKGSRLAHVPAEKTMLYQLVVSAPIFAVGVVAFGETFDGLPSTLAIGSVIYQAVWVVSVTFVIWFALMKRYSANRLSAFAFLTPLFGVAGGHLVLGDPITLAFTAASVLVVAGLVLVNRPG